MVIYGSGVWIGEDNDLGVYIDLRAWRLYIEREDEWYWKDTETQVYAIKSSVYKILCGEDVELYDLFWKIKALPSTHIFAWKVTHNRVIMCVNLINRGIVLRSRACVMCKLTNEPIIHLFFSCKVTGLCWICVLSTQLNKEIKFRDAYEWKLFGMYEIKKNLF